MENSIEKTKKQLELILKVRKEQKEIIECTGGACINCDPDIKALSESIEILSDYERVLKKNEELENKINEDCILIQKVKDKIKELEEKMKHEYNRIILVQLFKQRKVLQELLNK